MAEDKSDEWFSEVASRKNRLYEKSLQEAAVLLKDTSLNENDSLYF